MGKIAIGVDGYFGDGGKGQFGAIIGEEADVVARAGGGPNSGQQEPSGKTRHNLPIGSESERVKDVVIGSGCLVDPAILQSEFTLGNGELDPETLKKLRISDRAEILLPSHVFRDIARETSGKGVGSTRRGISPATQDRGYKIGLRFGHLQNPQIVEAQIQKQLEQSRIEDHFTASELSRDVLELTEPIRGCITNTAVLLENRLDAGKNIYIGGHQGAHLDWIHGTVPCSTSMGVSAPDMLGFLGIGLRPAHVTMIVKANPTRVGAGPQVAEIVDYEALKDRVMTHILERANMTQDQLDELDNTDPQAAGRIRKKYAPEFGLTEDELWVVENSRVAHAYANGDRPVGVAEPDYNRFRQILGENDPMTRWLDIMGTQMTVVGAEFGASTGRPRREAVLDKIALDHARRMNNPDSLAVTKLDVLSGIQPLPICIAYEIDIDGETHTTDVFPSDLDMLYNAKPVFDWLEGFSEDITGCRDIGDLPTGALAILSRLEKELRAPVDYVGVGKKREQTLMTRPISDFYR